MNVSIKIQQIANGWLLHGGHPGPKYFDTLDALKAALAVEIDDQILRVQEAHQAMEVEKSRYANDVCRQVRASDVQAGAW